MGRNNVRAAQLNIGVAFLGVSFGDKSARLGVAISRDYCDLDNADELFCDRRLSGLVVLGHADDDPKQFLIDADQPHVISAVFDVKGFNVTAEQIKIGLTFAKSELPNGELERFAKSSGRLVITKSEDIPIEKPEARSAATTPLLSEADEDEAAAGEFEDADAQHEDAAV